MDGWMDGRTDNIRTISPYPISYGLARIYFLPVFSTFPLTMLTHFVCSLCLWNDKKLVPRTIVAQKSVASQNIAQQIVAKKMLLL
jgi:hypothetical protein